MRGRHIRSSSRFEQLRELSCGLEPDVEGLNKLFIVRCRTVCRRDRSDAMHGMCSGQVLECVGFDRLHELSSGIEPDCDCLNDLLFLQCWKVFSRVRIKSLQRLFDG